MTLTNPDFNARRIAELERKVDLITDALSVLNKILDADNEMNEIDQKIFEDHRDRIKKLEDAHSYHL
jgi:hypothetical protein